MRGELAEFDVTEAEFDAMLAEGQSVEVTDRPTSPVGGSAAPAATNVVRGLPS